MSTQPEEINLRRRLPVDLIQWMRTAHARLKGESPILRTMLRAILAESRRIDDLTNPDERFASVTRCLTVIDQMRDDLRKASNDKGWKELNDSLDVMMMSHRRYGGHVDPLSGLCVEAAQVLAANRRAIKAKLQTKEMAESFNALIHCQFYDMLHSQEHLILLTRLLITRVDFYASLLSTSSAASAASAQLASIKTRLSNCLMHKLTPKYGAANSELHRTEGPPASEDTLPAVEHPAEGQRFKPGDVVRLKSGSPKMTVLLYTERGAVSLLRFNSKSSGIENIFVEEPCLILADDQRK